MNKTVKGRADTRGSSWVNNGRFSPVAELNPDTGSMSDLTRPGSPEYSLTKQIGPQSKTKFGLNRKA